MLLTSSNRCMALTSPLILIFTAESKPAALMYNRDIRPHKTKLHTSSSICFFFFFFTLGVCQSSREPMRSTCIHQYLPPGEWLPPIVPKSLETAGGRGGWEDAEGGEEAGPSPPPPPLSCVGSATETTMRQILTYMQVLCVWTTVFLTLIHTHAFTLLSTEAGTLISASFWMHTYPVTLSFLLTEQMPALLWLKLLSLGFHQRPLPLSPSSAPLSLFLLALFLIPQLYHAATSPEARLCSKRTWRTWGEQKLVTAAMGARGTAPRVMTGVDQGSSFIYSVRFVRFIRTLQVCHNFSLISAAFACPFLLYFLPNPLCSHVQHFITVQ